jgi:hypothetical protein
MIWLQVAPSPLRGANTSAEVNFTAGTAPSPLRGANTAGEAEARAATKRRDYTPEQRRGTFPLDDYDVPLDQLIVRRGIGLGPQELVLDPEQLKKPRGKIDAMYPAWGSTDFLPGATPRDFTIHKNPSPEEVERLKKRGDLRVLMNKEGTELYAWPADAALHPEVADDVFPGARVKDPKTGVWRNDYRQGIIPGARR